jgi:hypothetical protein
MERYMPMAWRPVFMPEGKHFVSEKSKFLIFGGQRSCDGRGGARSAPFGVAMSLKRRVRAAHGRARAAKTHLLFKYCSPSVLAKNWWRCTQLAASACKICFCVALSSILPAQFPNQISKGRQLNSKKHGPGCGLAKAKKYN